MGRVGKRQLRKTLDFVGMGHGGGMFEQRLQILMIKNDLEIK